MRLVANHCVAGSVLGRVPGPSKRGAGAVPALGLRQRCHGCAARLGSSSSNGRVRPALEASPHLSAWQICFRDVRDSSGCPWRGVT